MYQVIYKAANVSNTLAMSCRDQEEVDRWYALFAAPAYELYVTYGSIEDKEYPHLRTCPRCEDRYCRYPAISRADNKTPVCPDWACKKRLKRGPQTSQRRRSCDLPPLSQPACERNGAMRTADYDWAETADSPSEISVRVACWQVGGDHVYNPNTVV